MTFFGCKSSSKNSCDDLANNYREFINKAVAAFQIPIGKTSQAVMNTLNNATPSYPIKFLSREALQGEWVVVAASPLNHLPNDGRETTATLEPCESSLLFTVRRGRKNQRTISAVRTHCKYAQFAAVANDTFPVPVPFNVYGQYKSNLDLITDPTENPAYVVIGGYAGGNGWNGLPTLASFRGYGIILARRQFVDQSNITAINALVKALHVLGAPVFNFHPELNPFGALGLPDVPVVVPDAPANPGYDCHNDCYSSDSSSDCCCDGGLYDNLE